MSNEEKIFLLSMAEKDVEAQSSAYDWYKLGQDMMKRIALEKESNEIKAYLEELQELRAYLKELEEAEAEGRNMPVFYLPDELSDFLFWTQDKRGGCV